MPRDAGVVLGASAAFYADIVRRTARAMCCAGISNWVTRRALPDKWATDLHLTVGDSGST